MKDREAVLLRPSLGRTLFFVAIAAMSLNVGAVLAVSVMGPSYVSFEARMIAAASAASSRAVHDTGPSPGTAMTPVSCHGPRSQPRLCA